MYNFKNHQLGLFLITTMLMVSILVATGNLMLRVANSVKKISNSNVQLLQQTNIAREILNIVSNNLDQIIQNDINSGFTWVDTSTGIPLIAGSVSAADTSIAVLPTIDSSLINSGTLSVGSVVNLQSTGINLEDIANSVQNGGIASIYNNAVNVTINPLTSLINSSNIYGGYLVETLSVSQDSTNASNAIYNLRISSYSCSKGVNSGGTADQSNRTCVSGGVISSSNIVVTKKRICPTNMNLVIGLPKNTIYDLYCTCPQPGDGTDGTTMTTTSTGQCKSCSRGSTWNESLGRCQCGGNAYFDGNAATGNGSCVICTTGPVNSNRDGCTTCSNNSYYSLNTFTCVACTSGPVNSTGDGCSLCSSGTYWNGSSCATCTTGPIVNGACTTCGGTNIYWNGSNCVTCTSGPVVSGSCTTCLSSGSNTYWNVSSCTSCPSATPYWDGSSCNSCPNSTPYWNGSSCAVCPNGASTSGTGQDVGNGCSCNSTALAYWDGACRPSCSSLLPLYVGSATFANRVDQQKPGYYGGGYCSEGGGISGCTTGCSAWGYNYATLSSDNASCLCQTNCPNSTPYWDGSSCTTCPSGATCSNNTATCNDSNQYVSGDSCVTCSTGPVQNGTCTTCSGTTPYWNGNSCTTCPGSTPYWNGSSCTTCPSSTPYWNGSSCTTCPSSSPAWDGSSCTNCPSSSPAWNGSSCTACPSSAPYWNGSSCSNNCGSMWFNGTSCASCPSGNSCSNGQITGCQSGFPVCVCYTPGWGYSGIYYNNFNCYVLNGNDLISIDFSTDCHWLCSNLQTIGYPYAPSNSTYACGPVCNTGNCTTTHYTSPACLCP